MLKNNVLGLEIEPSWPSLSTPTQRTESPKIVFRTKLNKTITKKKKNNPKTIIRTLKKCIRTLKKCIRTLKKCYRTLKKCIRT